MNHKDSKKNPGPKLNTLKIQWDWRDAMKKALEKKPPTKELAQTEEIEQ